MLCKFCKKELANAKFDYHPECFGIHRNEYMKKKMREYRYSLKTLIGASCYICNSKEKIIFHEKSGKNHVIPDAYRGHINLSYYRKNYKDFISLCREHHKLLHKLHKSFKSKEEEQRFYSLLSLL